MALEKFKSLLFCVGNDTGEVDVMFCAGNGTREVEVIIVLCREWS